MSRIAILTPYARPVPGGISTFVDGLSRLLRRHGHEVAIFAGEGCGDIPSRSDLGRGFSYRRRVKRGLQDFSPQIIHAHSHWYTLAAGAGYVARFSGPRLVFSFHTTTVPRWKTLFARLLKRAHVVTFTGCAQLEEIRRLLHLSGDLRLLYPAIDPPLKPAEASHGPGLKRGDEPFPLLAFVGPLEYERKVQGVVELVRNLSVIQAVFPKVKLLIVGDGRLRYAVERSAVGLGSAVEITGYLDDPGIILDMVDVYCHISHQEGLPLALLEAMAHQRAILATPVGAIPEVLDGSNGILVENEEALPRSVIRLAQDAELRAKLGVAAGDTFRDGYTWDARWPAVASVYGLE